MALAGLSPMSRTTRPRIDSRRRTRPLRQPATNAGGKTSYCHDGKKPLGDRAELRIRPAGWLRDVAGSQPRASDSGRVGVAGVVDSRSPAQRVRPGAVSLFRYRRAVTVRRT